MKRQKVNVNIQLVAVSACGPLTDSSLDPVHKVGSMFRFRHFEGDVCDLRHAIAKKNYTLTNHMHFSTIRIFRARLSCLPQDTSQMTFCLGDDAVELDSHEEISELNMTEDEYLAAVAPYHTRWLHWKLR